MNIHITGAAGFIGSNLIRYLNHYNIVPFAYANLNDDNWKNLNGLKCEIRRKEDIFSASIYGCDIIVHLSANSSTSASFEDGVWESNFEYSKKVLNLREKNSTKVIYASSASVYGDGKKGFVETQEGLVTNNAYAFSKLKIDELAKPSWTPIFGLRFFNVYGPNETHKGNMKSAIATALIGKANGTSSFTVFEDNKTKTEIQRDFVHVDDVCSVIKHFIDDEKGLIPNGVYNVGTGVSEKFDAIAKIVGLDIARRELPDAMRKGYQHYSCANLEKLRTVAGYKKSFMGLKHGIENTLPFYERA